MTIREYNLARQGHERQLEDRRRREAEWMSMILNSQYHEAEITAAMLLGEETSDRATLMDAKKVAEKMARVLAKRKARGPVQLIEREVTTEFLTTKRR